MTKENFWEKYGRSDNYKEFMSDLKLVVEDETRPGAERCEIILSKVCECLTESVDEVKSKWRLRELAEARFCFYRIAHQEMKMTVTAIGKFMGRNHCGVVYGIAQTRNVAELAKKYSKVLDYVKKYI